MSKYVDARRQSDARAIEALFTADADQLVSSGEWRKGREAVVSGTLASSQSTGGTRTITVESIRFVSPDVAVADGRYEISRTFRWPDPADVVHVRFQPHPKWLAHRGNPEYAAGRARTVRAPLNRKVPGDSLALAREQALTQVRNGVSDFASHNSSLPL